MTKIIKKLLILIKVIVIIAIVVWLVKISINLYIWSAYFDDGKVEKDFKENTETFNRLAEYYKSKDYSFLQNYKEYDVVTIDGIEYKYYWTNENLVLDIKNGQVEKFNEMLYGDGVATLEEAVDYYYYYVKIDKINHQLKNIVVDVSNYKKLSRINNFLRKTTGTTAAVHNNDYLIYYNDSKENEEHEGKKLSDGWYKE